MGLWVKRPVLRAGEKVSWRRGANRSQGNRVVGGRIFVTNQRLIFVPNRLDSITGGHHWSVLLNEIEDVRLEERDMSLWLSGGLRNRLGVGCRGGDSQLFVVNHVREVIKLLDSARESGRGKIEI